MLHYRRAQQPPSNEPGDLDAELNQLLLQTSQFVNNNNNNNNNSNNNGLNVDHQSIDVKPAMFAQPTTTTTNMQRNAINNTTASSTTANVPTAIKLEHNAAADDDIARLVDTTSRFVTHGDATMIATALPPSSTTSSSTMPPLSNHATQQQQLDTTLTALATTSATTQQPTSSTRTTPLLPSKLQSRSKVFDSFVCAARL
jgi:hypothetical protein